jgi:hypothetical protein
MFIIDSLVDAVLRIVSSVYILQGCKGDSIFQSSCLISSEFRGDIGCFLGLESWSNYFMYLMVRVVVKTNDRRNAGELGRGDG